MRFGDTDAAGVMHFHQLFRWSHEAWEESLELYGVSAGSVFPGCRVQPQVPEVALPVVHCHADFLKPVHGGDQLIVQLDPQRLDPSCFEVRSVFSLEDKPVARSLIRHLAIDIESRRRCILPAHIDRWLEASGLGQIRAL